MRTGKGGFMAEGEKVNLFEKYKRKVFRGENLKEISFPIGGIGTGSISLSGRGELVDWEIFNRPNTDYRPDLTFFSLWTRGEKEEQPVFRVLEGPVPKSHSRHWTRNRTEGNAPYRNFAPGLGRMQRTEFSGEYPFSRVDYFDEAIPLNVSLVGFNPFIPLDDENSSLPVAIFIMELENPTENAVDATAALTLQNFLGYPDPGCSVNSFREEDKFRGLFLESRKYPEDSGRFGTLAVGTTWEQVTRQTCWRRGPWWMGLQDFYNRHIQTGVFDNDPGREEPSGENESDFASLGLRVKLGPAEKVRLPFILSWHFPNYEYRLSEDFFKCLCEGQGPKWKNFYATRFDSAWEVLAYTAENLDSLYKRTLKFKDSLFNSTLPGSVIEAVSRNLSVLKTATCLRLEDGSFYGFEGACGAQGCCPGTCTHVWNYAQALPFLFPKLERSLRENEFQYSVRQEDGHMQFRMPLPPGTKAQHDFHAAVDGQLGTVLKLYREWLICGDDEWLKQWWPTARKVLEYAWEKWDADQTGLIDAEHHNTYDIEFFGPDPLATSFYLAALLAGAKMARRLKQPEVAEKYLEIYDSGRRKMDELLFNGNYYEQAIDNPDEKPFQFGKGCLADQLIGQWYADLLDLGFIAKKENIRKALLSIYQYNFREGFSDFHHAQRAYALGDDAGLLLCAFPQGERPEFPLVYCDEVWSGIEYQVAAELIFQGFVEQGLRIVEAVIQRHRGDNRNPWNEVECGNHYARSMSSYSLLNALSGFFYSAPAGEIRFAPRLSIEDFQCFFSVGCGWGTFSQKWVAPRELIVDIGIEEGQLELHCLNLGAVPHWAVFEQGVECEGPRVDISPQGKGWVLNFIKPVLITPDAPLRCLMIAPGGQRGQKGEKIDRDFQAG
jgi:non-lysosomal glucosylceramidase